MCHISPYLLIPVPKTYVAGIPTPAPSHSNSYPSADLDCVDQGVQW